MTILISREAGPGISRKLVYSRRNWKKRRNQEDLIVSAQANLSWPGLSIEQKQGMPLDEYGIMSADDDWIASNNSDTVKLGGT